MADLFSTDLETRKLRLELRLAQLDHVERSQEDFLSFVKSMWPDFISGRHHEIVSEKLEKIASGELKRLIVNMPHGIPSPNSPVSCYRHG